MELFNRQSSQEEAHKSLTHEKLRIEGELKNIQKENQLLKMTNELKTNTSTIKSNENLLNEFKIKVKLNDQLFWGIILTLSVQEQQNNKLKTLNEEILIQNNVLIQDQESLKFKNKELEKQNKILSDSLIHSREEFNLLNSNQIEKNNKVI